MNMEQKKILERQKKNCLRILQAHLYIKENLDLCVEYKGMAIYVLLDLVTRYSHLDN